MNLHLSIFTLAATLFCSCAARDPYASQRLSPTQVAAHNARIRAPAPAPGAARSYGVPSGLTAPRGYTLPNNGRGYQLVYNPFEDRWTYARPGTTPRYNAMEDRWEMARESDELRYNAMEDYFQYVPRNAETRYNAMEDRFQFANPNDDLKYNAMEDKWQYAPPNSSLHYNAMEDKWQYVPDE